MDRAQSDINSMTPIRSIESKRVQPISGWHGFFSVYENTITMKKYSIIIGLLMLIGFSVSSCHAGAHIGTKHHEVGVGASAH
jgi:hypothetical protein